MSGEEKPERFESITYRDSGDDLQSWTGPASDWKEHARICCIRADDVVDHFAFVGFVVPTANLEWPCE